MLQAWTVALAESFLQVLSGEFMQQINVYGLCEWHDGHSCRLRHMLLFQVLRDADEKRGSTCAFAVVDALGSKRWCACSIKSPVQHVVYLRNMRCIVHVPIFISTNDHLLTMPERLRAFETVTSRSPIHEMQHRPSYLSHTNVCLTGGLRRWKAPNLATTSTG